MPKVRQNAEIRVAESNIPDTISKSEIAKRVGVSRALFARTDDAVNIEG